MFAYLTLSVDQKPGRTFVLQAGENLIGRGPECQVVLADPLCSRVHAVLEEREGQWQVRDQSRNGTFLNEQAVQQAILADGSVLRIGATELAFHLGEQTPTLAAPLDPGLTQTIVRDTPVTQHDASELAMGSLRDTPEGQDLWLLHQFTVRLLARRPRDEILRDALQVLQHRTEASAVAYFTLDVHRQLRREFSAPDDGLLGPLPSEALTQLLTAQGRALWVANQHARGRAGGAAYEADVLYVPVVCGNRVIGALYVYLQHGHFRQSQFDFTVAVANLASRALVRGREDDRLECDLAQAAAELGIGQELIGPSPAIAELREQLSRIALAGGHVLLRGERGAGKGLVARLLHDASGQLVGGVSGPFAVVVCGQVAGEGAELEDWSKAQGGTLYLAEIDRLSTESQGRLLRQLAPGSEVRAHDADGELAAERVIAATTLDLRGLARRGEFSAELVDLLSQHELLVPPLRERREDIPALIDHFLTAIRLRYGRGDLTLSDAARERLVEQEWPGNVRQLRHVLELASLTASGAIIEVNDLPVAGGAFEEWESLRIDHWERRLIMLALRRAGGGVPEAAQLLGIGRATLYRKLEEYGIQR